VLSGQFDWGGLLNVGRSDGNVRVVLGYMLGSPSPTRRSLPLPNGGEGVEHPALLVAPAAVKMRPARTISREVFVTPQRLHARHPFGMVI
jgi:hypothetical protein